MTFGVSLTWNGADSCPNVSDRTDDFSLNRILRISLDI